MSYDGSRPSAEPVARADIPRGKRHHHSHRAGRPRQPATAAGGLYRDQSAAAVVRDDGAVLTESVAVCRYFEALHLDPPLFGRDAERLDRDVEPSRSLHPGLDGVPAFCIRP